MSSQWRILRNATTGRVILARAKWCTSFFCHFKGLQFVQRLPENQGVLFVTQSESRTTTSIHMFFMFISIGVLWLDKNGQVVHKTLAKPWRPYYASPKPAQYFIEANPSILDQVDIGDVLRFDEGTV